MISSLGIKPDTLLQVSSDKEQSEIDAFRSIIEQQQEKVKTLDITLCHRNEELQQIRQELANAKACARYTKFEKLRVSWIRMVEMDIGDVWNYEWIWR